MESEEISWPSITLSLLMEPDQSLYQKNNKNTPNGRWYDIDNTDTALMKDITWSELLKRHSWLLLVVRLYEF